MAKLNDKISHRDSKWDILRQPEWARKFLNLKQSAIHYNHNDLLGKDDGTDVSIYRKAVLFFFLEEFGNAIPAFVNVIEYLEITKEDAERAYFLKGNAYLKAGFSLFLKYSSELQKKLEGLDCHKGINSEENLKVMLRELIDSIYKAFKEIENFTLLNENDLMKYQLTSDVDVDSNPTGIMSRIIKLLNLSALSFERGKLYSNAAISYLSMVMVWEAFLEVLPWEKSKNTDYWDEVIDIQSSLKYQCIKETIKIIRIENSENWIFKAQQRAFDRTGINTGEAYHHFMKSVLERNLKKKHIIDPANK